MAAIDQMNADEIERMAQELAEKAKQMRADARKAELEARQAKEAAKRDGHYEKLRQDGAELASLNDAQHAIVYAQAWEHGHDGGYSKVESYYGEFAEMARQLLEVADQPAPIFNNGEQG